MQQRRSGEHGRGCKLSAANKPSPETTRTQKQNQKSNTHQNKQPKQKQNRKLIRGETINSTGLLECILADKLLLYFCSPRHFRPPILILAYPQTVPTRPKKHHSKLQLPSERNHISHVQCYHRDRRSARNSAAIQNHGEEHDDDSFSIKASKNGEKRKRPGPQAPVTLGAPMVSKESIWHNGKGRAAWVHCSSQSMFHDHVASSAEADSLALNGTQAYKPKIMYWRQPRLKYNIQAGNRQDMH